MRDLDIRKIIERIILFTALLVLLYLLALLFFSHHYFLNTRINGVNVSFMSEKEAESCIRSYIRKYEISLIEINGNTEVIAGQDIGMEYNSNIGISRILQRQIPSKSIGFIFKHKNYYQDNLYLYDADGLNRKIDQLSCLNKKMIEPHNVGFKFSNGAYTLVNEICGNKIKKDKLYVAMKYSIARGIPKLNLEEMLCYEKPKYTKASNKAALTRKLLNKYISTKITYSFGNKKELLDGNIINQWLMVNENLDVIIEMAAVRKYVKDLAFHYNTVGIARNFKTSGGKIVKVSGGLYGWKIDQEAETRETIKNIKNSVVIEKEPVYAQRALCYGENDIGNTYIEVNITKQHLWFYKEGKLITHGSVVTGNPNRGNATVLGSYMVNYKQKDTRLKGHNYNVKVTYWTPFYGNIGIHDAIWRNSFGGEIYKRNGTHGCVNAPFYLAKKIFENIEAGIPVICYEE